MMDYEDALRGPFFGGCQCGNVRFRVPELAEPGHLCHCRMCQKATGNLFAALVSVSRDTLVWTRSEPGSFYSSDTVRRLFCATCGTPLGYAGDEDAHWGLSIGAFDKAAAIPVDMQSDTYARHPVMVALDSLQKMGPEPTEQDPRGATSHQHPDRDEG